MKQLLILAITLVITTFIILICNPSLKKEVRILNAQYNIQAQNAQTVETKTANIQNQNVTQNQTVKMNNVEQKIVSKNVNVTNNAPAPVQKVQKVQNTNVAKNVSVKTNTVNQTTVQKTTVKPVQTVKQTTPVQTTVATKTPSQPVQPVTQQPKTTPQKTAEQVQKEKAAQEAISWNKWRANVHNQIISQVNLPTVPAGTAFTYSFTVTKDGTISNIKTTSVAPQYTALAIQYIAPVVRRSAHASFLRFPSGTERTVVDVKYTFKTTNSGSGTQASANNFNDVEIIKK